MNDKASSILISLMTSIDEVKDKISDGEYLNLCNLLKSLNDEIKNQSSEEEEEDDDDDDDDDDEEDDEEEDEYRPSSDRGLSIEERIDFWFKEPFYNTNIDDPHLTAEQTLELLNYFLVEIIEKEQQGDNIPWFQCPCGCTLRANDISEHINSNNHIENVRPFFG